MNRTSSITLRRGLSAMILAAVIAAPAAAAERARNVILFIGDGMGVSTLTAARIFAGQKRGLDGASNLLSFETFPDLALVRTFSADSLVTESAAGATALLTGRRTLNGVLGVSDKVRIGDCASSKATSVATLAELAKQKGLATGVVSTAAITDATPASLYAHVPTRTWQSDADMPPEALAAGCVDIARQMVDGPADLQLDLMLGGGYGAFKPAESATGRRNDGRDLTAEWRAKGGLYIETGAELAALPTTSRKVLGLFAPGNMMRESTRQATQTDAPRLVDMTRKAIEILSREKAGYFLMVEGALIDKAHHLNLAHEALNETVEFDEAVAAALAMTNPADTLIVVTADHSHSLTLNGGLRNSSVLDVAPSTDDDPRVALDGKALSILMYATGPGAPIGEPRSDPAQSDPKDPDLRAPAAVPLPSAAHTGEDVAAYAKGPGARAFHGLIEQPAVFEAMRTALGL